MMAPWCRKMIDYIGLLCFVALAPFAHANESTGVIQGRLQFPNKQAFTETTRISVNHGERHTYSRPDGSFTLYDIEPGVHVVDVYNQAFHFAQINCHFLKEAMDRPNCFEYIYQGARELPATHPLVLTTLAGIEYFEAKRGFSLFSIVKNPMMLMMLFSVAMMYFMPKMMEGMDPEEKARFKQQMAMQNDPKKMMAQFFGDGSDGSGEQKAITANK